MVRNVNLCCLCIELTIAGTAPLNQSQKADRCAEEVADEGDPGGGRESLIGPGHPHLTQENPAENGLRNNRNCSKNKVRILILEYASKGRGDW